MGVMMMMMTQHEAVKFRKRQTTSEGLNGNFSKLNTGKRPIKDLESLKQQQLARGLDEFSNCCI